MTKRKIKQFFKESRGGFAFIIWMILISYSFIYAVEGKSFRIKLCLGVICTIYNIIGLAMLDIWAEKSEKQKAENKNKRLQELQEKDRYYVDLVDKQTKEMLNKLKNESININIDTSLEYLISFSDKVNWVCNHRIIGKPDSFIIATCLMYSLISNPVIVLNNFNNDNDLNAIIFSINMDIAMNCVFEIISEPSTYFEDNGIWVEEKHPKVNIVVPEGLIKNNPLYRRILNTIYWDEKMDNRTSIMQFSNLLHLIYWNCQCR